MTKPKTIETTLVWNRCVDKMPPDGSEVLICFDGGLIHYAEYSTLWELFGDKATYIEHFLITERVVFPDEVKYWAELPTLPEEE
jgi:hypothetical protein